MTMDPRPNISSHRLHAHLQPCPRRIVGLVANGLALTGPVVLSCCIGFPLFPCARVGVSVARCARCACCALSYFDPSYEGMQAKRHHQCVKREPV